MTTVIENKGKALTLPRFLLDLIVKLRNYEDKIAGYSPYASMLFTHMLMEDLSYGVLPFPSGANSTPVIRIEPEDKLLESEIAGSFLPRNSRDVLDHAVRELFRRCLWQILLYRNVRLLVYFEEDNDEENHPLRFSVRDFNRNVSIRFRGRVYEFIKTLDASQRIVAVLHEHPHKLLVVSSPSNKTKGEIAKAFGALRVVDDPRKMMARLNTSLSGASDVEIERLVVLEATKDIGWNMRSGPDELINEYYYFDRYLTFEAFKIELREYISGLLNAILENVGHRLGFECRVLIEGLPTLAEVRETRSKLREGGITFKDVVERFN